MSPVELVLLAELHANGDPVVLAAARRDPECARVLAALDLVAWELQQLGTNSPRPR
jgi:hypothetical protein